MDQSSVEAMGFIQQYQIVITGAFAIVAALIGFGGIVYAQFRIAKNAQEEREHREKISAQERQQKISDRRTTLIHALTGELSSLYQQINYHINWYRTQRVIYEAMLKEFGEHHGHHESPLNIPKFETIIFDSFVSDIGLLPPSITASVAKIYGQLRRREVRDSEKKLPVGQLTQVLKALEESFADSRNSIHDLTMRLHAIRLGYDDPGEGLGSVDIHLRARNEATRWMAARKLVSVLS